MSSRSALLPPRYIKGETEDSFIARVKTWERVTGKKYPISRFGKMYVEERILGGERFLRSALDKYTSYASEADLKDYEQEISIAKANDPAYKKAAEEARIHAQDEKKWTDFAEFVNRTPGAIPNFDKLDPAGWEEFYLLQEKERQAENKAKVENVNDVKTEPAVKPEPGSEVPVEATQLSSAAKKEEKPSYGWSTVFHTTDAHGNPQVLTKNQREKWEEENQDMKDIPLEELLGTWGR